MGPGFAASIGESIVTGIIVVLIMAVILGGLFGYFVATHG